jgi:hypothetical protein
MRRTRPAKLGHASSLRHNRGECSMPHVKAESPTPQRSVRATHGGIGKVVCTSTFHCVKASDAPVFYKILAQLK